MQAKRRKFSWWVKDFLWPLGRAIVSALVCFRKCFRLPFRALSFPHETSLEKHTPSTRKVALWDCGLHPRKNATRNPQLFLIFLMRACAYMRTLYI